MSDHVSLTPRPEAGSRIRAATSPNGQGAKPASWADDEVVHARLEAMSVVL